MADILTGSACRAYRSCPRKYCNAYELRRRPRRKAETLTRGTATHGGLESLWRGGEPVCPSMDDPFEAVLVQTMLDGYLVRWGRPERVEAVELEFEVPLINPLTGHDSRTWTLGGKLDAAWRDESGALWVVEHKTSSEDISPGSDYWRKLRLDAQVSTYLQAARMLNLEAVGVLYDVLGVPKLRPLKATPVESRKYTKAGALYAQQRESDESPEEYRERLLEEVASNPDRYYQRGEVVRLEAETDRAALNLWQVACFIRDSRRLKLWPQNSDACFQWHRPCEYFDVCTGVASLDDETLFETTERNPEL